MLYAIKYYTATLHYFIVAKNINEKLKYEMRPQHGEPEPIF